MDWFANSNVKHLQFITYLFDNQYYYTSESQNNILLCNMKLEINVNNDMIKYCDNK